MGEHGTVGPTRQHGHQHSGVGLCSGQHGWCIPGPQGGLGGPRESVAPPPWEFSQLRAAPCKRAEPYLVKLDYLDVDSNSVERVMETPTGRATPVASFTDVQSSWGANPWEDTGPKGKC